MSTGYSADNGLGTVLVISAFFIAIVFSVIIIGISIWGWISSGHSSPFLTYKRCSITQLIVAGLFLAAIAVIGGLVIWKYTTALSTIQGKWQASDLRNKKALAECKRRLGGLLYNIDDDTLEAAYGIDAAELQAIKGKYRADV